MDHNQPKVAKIIKFAKMFTKKHPKINTIITGGTRHTLFGE